LPDTIQFKYGNQIVNRYAADGRKLDTEYFTLLTDLTDPLKVDSVKNMTYTPNIINQNGVAYIDNKEYNKFNEYWGASISISLVHNTEGYVQYGTPPNSGFIYYRTDHLGNNREVWRASSKATIQRTQYYASGLPWETTPADNLSLQPYKYNGKEFVEMHGYDTYDYGARGYYAAMARFTSVDPLCEKYYSISPYAYCAGNPIRFIDPNGEEIWIYYTDGDRNKQKIQYTQGADYKGNDTFVSNTFSYLNAINNNGGSDMLDILSSSKNSFDFVNQPTTDKNGNTIVGALNFDGNQSGGGTIYAGALMGNTSEYSKIESASHELFHGLQQEQGQGGASVYNEVEANVYSSNITSNWRYNTNYVGGMSGNGLGNSTSTGVLYQQSFDNLTKSFSNPDFVNAVRSFQGGSEKNASGLYNRYPLQRSNQTRSILQQFYPKRL
jgi:RHS repeat-associated protein